MMKVDKEKCIGCGACVSLCPDTFAMKNSKATVISEKDCDEAMNACPVAAIEQVE